MCTPSIVTSEGPSEGSLYPTILTFITGANGD